MDAKPLSNNSQTTSLNEIPKNPLNRIALCLSGGGYRAASFHLGIMSYLSDKPFFGNPLLQNVKAISTVSGGTITGVVYAMLTQEGKSFDDIYKYLTSWLYKVDLADDSLKKISIKGKWNYPYKHKNFINAFAELYDETLTKGKTMHVFDNFKKSHLEFVCFNSTEFNNGLRYRFQTGGKYNYFGSNGLRLGKGIYKEFRLSDIISASSAFPGGFEPISMPNDFLATESEAYKLIKKLKNEYKEGPVGLMDGGIYDNQGISSIEDYQNRKSTEPFDLIFICDVSSPHLDPFDFTDTKSGGIREKTINDLVKLQKTRFSRIIIGVISFFIIGIALIFFSKFSNSALLGIGASISVFGLIILTGLLITKNKILNFLNGISENLIKKIPPYFKERIRSLDYKNTKLKHIEVLLLDRFYSLSMLISEIFLKQIRRLHYNRIYDNNDYEFKRVSCLVKELTPVDFKKKLSRDYKPISKYIPEFKGSTYTKIIGNKIKPYVNDAAEFGTTLWFTDKDKLEKQLKALIISGQITCCQNLLIYLSKLIYTKNNEFSKLDNNTKREIKKLHKTILNDWREFKKEPDFLYNELSSN